MIILLSIQEVKEKFKENNYVVTPMTNEEMVMLAKDERIITDIETALRDCNDDIYVIEGVEPDKETGETMLIYRGLYGKKVQTRPYVMILENV